MERFKRIFKILKDRKWHKKSDFCRPWSDDIRRLREMKSNGYVNYIFRKITNGTQVRWTEYKLTKINPDFKKIIK